MTKKKKPTTPRPTKEPSANGAAPKPRRQRKPVSAVQELLDRQDAERAPPTITPAADPCTVEPSAPPQIGRLASTIEPEAWSWLVEDLIPYGCLTFVCGHPDAGKSCFGAWLMSQARRSVALSGDAESAALHLIPRLDSAGCDRSKVLLLDDRHYRIPQDCDVIGRAVQSIGAELVWIDPIDSYLSIESENDGVAVRDALEPLGKLAANLRIAVVVVRHPGKARGNVCPGNRQWLAVPRIVIELLGSGRTQRRPILRIRKGPQRHSTGPRAYALVNDSGVAPRFRLGANATEVEAELLQDDDFVSQLKTDAAIELITGFLGEEEQPASMVRSMADREGIADRTVQLAAKRLGVEYRRHGSGRDHICYWRMPGTPAGTGAERHTHTPTARVEAPKPAQ